MKISDFVKVNTYYTRSINLERDIGSSGAISSYIPTSRALRTSHRVAAAFGTGVAPRAWSLVGPYGSGKSSFALFLSALLQDPKNDNTNLAVKVLKQADPELAKTITKHTRDSSGYLRVMLTGSPEALSKRLVVALSETANAHWSARRGKKPAVLQRLQSAIMSEKPLSANDVVSIVKDLQVQLRKTGSLGLVIVIDELGKFLEYEARHYGANDIYLLQSLAEHACAGGEVRLFLFVLLHQSFEQYAKGLGESLKREWSKIQGRFEEIPFIESAEQVMRILSVAFEQKLPVSPARALAKRTKSISKSLSEQSALPAGLAETDANKLFEACYPLHPVTSLLLPALCQKVAQNERTLFSYLGSHEEYGMQDLLTRFASVEEYVLPHHIYDYFVTNQPAVLGDYLTHRRWAEVVTALERIGDSDQTSLNLLKTIGILNIIGGKGGFRASPEVLSTLFDNSDAFKKAIRYLESESVITFRKFSGEYRVWQGSDFDLESAVSDWLNNLGDFPLADSLTKNCSMAPVIARRYAVENGALRFFEPAFIDATSLKAFEITVDQPRILFFLASAKDDERLFHDQVIGRFSSTNDVLALCLNGSQLREALAEVLALEKVGHTIQELHSDPIAKREFEDRATAARGALDQTIDDLMGAPANREWYFAGKRLAVASKRELQERLSDVMASAFRLAPKVKNELINRDKPSSQANAARNKLLAAMLAHPQQLDLGIQKYPAEKSLYRSILRKTGLHRLQDQETGLWAFSHPGEDGSQDALNMLPVWQKIQEFLKSTESSPRPLSDLNSTLIAAPYGVKIGLLPIIYVTAYLVHKDELALYEDGRYVAGFTADMLERFVKRPDEYTIQRFNLDGMRAGLLREYSEVIQFKDPANATMLGFASELAKYFGSLPEYTKKTRRGLSEKALAVRTEFNLSKSPGNLLLNTLPEILGFSAEADNVGASGFAHELKTVLAEFNQAYPIMIDRQRELLAQAFNMRRSTPVSKIREQLVHECAGLEAYTIDRSFLNQINDESPSDDEWLESLLSFLGHKPTRKWGDADQDNAEYRLSTYARKLVDLLKLKTHELDRRHEQSSEFDVYLLRVVKKGSDIKDQVVAVDPKSNELISHSIKEMEISLSTLPEKELRLAALARLVSAFLDEYGSSEQRAPAIHEPSKAYLDLVIGGDRHE
jgi:hypothetical protein